MRNSSKTIGPKLGQGELFSAPAADQRDGDPAPFEEAESQSDRTADTREISAQRRPALSRSRVAASATGRPVHLLDVRAAAAWLGLSKSTLDKMRCYGVGPKFIRATGKAVRYDPADLAAFADGRRQSRTTDELPT